MSSPPTLPKRVCARVNVLVPKQLEDLFAQGLARMTGIAASSMVCVSWSPCKATGAL